MVAPTVDVNAAYAAVSAEIAPSLPTGVKVYRPGKVPGWNGNTGSLPQMWVQLTIERRYTETTHGVRARTRTAFRAYVRSVADTEHNADELTRCCTEVLEDALLTVDGDASTPVEHETSEAVRPDDGKFSGLTAFTFTL
ncbi:hypothetical protein ACIRON_02715 [Nocardioides sp. NPDC101246]|uniref:hypothetical protein n=1 Tax=Nocardioides sp. NPDC101246 TaxID=3364336 RepID=UPI00382E8FA8